MIPQDSRARILATATGLFAQHGYAGVGMREVAAQSGLSKSALFHHFPSKSRLYGAVLRRILEVVNGRLSSAAEALGSDCDPLAQLEGWVHEVIDVLVEHPMYARLLLRSLFEDEPLEPQDAQATEQAMAATIARATEVLRRGMAQGRFRRVSVSHTVQSLIGLIVFHFASGEFGQQLFGGSVFEDQQVARRKEHVVALMRGLLRVDA